MDLGQRKLQMKIGNNGDIFDRYGIDLEELARTVHEIISKLQLPHNPTNIDIKQAVENSLKASIRIIAEKLPPTISGYSKRQSENNYLIVINSKLPESLRSSIILHELMHIYLGDVEEINKIACCSLVMASSWESPLEITVNNTTYQINQEPVNELMVECLSDSLDVIMMPELGRIVEGYTYYWHPELDKMD